MFSPVDEDDHSFSPNQRNKRRWSHKTLSDGEESELSLSKCKRSLDYKNDSASKNLKLSNSTISTSNNNSISHPALSGEKSGVSHSTPINYNDLSPTKGRRSLIIDKFVLQDDDEINDDAEELRVERENQISAQDSALEPEKGLKSLEVLAHCLDSELSSEQLADHLANCIELNAANKINVNNAFNLKLIDYMVVLLKRNDQTMKDFPTMSCSLDASTRIYACRVDNVHAGVMELVTGLAGTLNKHRKKKSKDPDNPNNDNSGDDDEDDEGGRASRRGKTKRRKAVLASSKKAISRNNIELAHWMSRRAIEPNFTVLLNTAKMTQSSDAGLSLLKDSVPLIPEKTTAAEVPLKEPTVDIEFPVLTEARSSLFGASFRFNWDEEAERPSQASTSSKFNPKDVIQPDEFTQSQEVSNLSEYPVETDPFDMDSFAEGLPDLPSDNDDVPEVEFAEPEEPKVDVLPFDTLTEDERKHGLKRNKNRKDRIDALNIVNSKMILADSDNDYSYMNTDVLPLMWAGPDHWKPVLKRGKTSHFSVAECAEKKVKKVKKKFTEGLSYDDFSMLDSIYSKKVNAMHQSKAVKKWAETKVTYPVQKEYNANILFRSFLRKTLFWKPLVKIEEDSDEFKVEVEYADNIDDISEDSNIADGIADFQEHDEFNHNDPPTVPDDQSDNGDVDNLDIEPTSDHEDNVAPQKSEISLTSKLVPVPKMVDCGNITYATVPKRVNMKRLKETCWNLMDFDSDKENQAKNSVNDNGEKTVLFSKLYLELPKHLPSDSRNDLSPALAFLAILHLANEKMLNLCPVNKEFDKDNTDFIIKRVS